MPIPSARPGVALLLVAVSSLAACGPAAGPDAAPAEPADALTQIKAAIAQKARAADGGSACRDLIMPDEMFMRVELTGQAPEEVAVSLDRLPCPPGVFSGTAGGVMQFWTLDGDRARLILEQQMRQFSAAGGTLVTLQHGGECGAPGTRHCRVTYRWDAAERRLAPAARALAPSPVARMEYDYRLRPPGA